MRLRLRAPAKLNLALEVLGRRADGFHELISVVQCVDLMDVLEGETAKALSLEAPAELGRAEDNLVLRAAVELRGAAGVRAGARLRLSKRIPAAAGLGGGSSDGAAALRLLARLWGLRRGSVDLARIAAGLGSDVPLFLGGPAALIAGRGERVQVLPPVGGGVFVIVVPPWRVERKTARVFAALEPGEYETGERARALAGALEWGQAVDSRLFVNGLEAAAGRVFGGLGELRERLERVTGVRFTLSGAGPALFWMAEDPTAARACAEQAVGVDGEVHVARPLRRMPVVRKAAHSARQ